MKNTYKLLLALLGIVILMAACQKEDPLPFYEKGQAVVLNSSTATIAANPGDAEKEVLTLSWTWPGYATDSSNQKFIIQMDTTGNNFASPATKTVSGVRSVTYTAEELNDIVFGYGTAIAKPFGIDIRVLSSYGNNNEQYASNVVKVTVTPYIKPINLSITPSTPLVLNIGNANATAITFTWNQTEFGNVPLNYAIQIDKKGNDFKNPYTVTFGDATEGTITVNDLNAAAVNAGIAPDQTGDLEFRVIAYQGDNFTNPVYSNIAEAKVTTYLAFVSWSVPGGYVEESYPCSTWKNWSPDASPLVESMPGNPTMLEGYIYMAGANNEFKVTPDKSWGTDLGDGGPGKLAPGNNIQLPAGYYKFNINSATREYTAVHTAWGVIGSATPKSWDDETPLSYYACAQKWMGGVKLTEGEIKFRANHDWAFNYGGADGKLTAGGSNIPVATAGDYFITLDLSKPSNYTYSMNMWGVIGSATAGGWDSDQDTTWDPVNKVMTATLTLVPGELKFRANNGWDVNLGGELSGLTPGGSNIAISEGGTYRITLDLTKVKPVATITKI